jgi:AraC family transcriptional regulator of adaptative response / DNA-3-methyladenine glycosylase II
VERVDTDHYARTVAVEGRAAVVRVGRPAPTHGAGGRAANALELRIEGAPASALFRLTADARRAFDLSADPTLIAATFAGDPLLGRLVRRRPGLRIPGAWDPFECAVRAVLGQQVSVAAGRTLANRLVERAGTRLAAPSGGLTHLFPSPAALASADLSGVGLTSARASTLQAMARAVADGRLDLRASAEEVVEGLRALAGIGDWTAQYVALRALGEPDAFPAADLVLRRVAGRGRGPLTARALEQRAEAWRPWRGYAVFHLWAAAAADSRNGD